VAFFVFGLTGGIACGKSTVAGRFRDAGITVIDADQVARQAVAPGTSGLAEIVKHFGKDVLRPDGTLDRAKLGAGTEDPSQAAFWIPGQSINAQYVSPQWTVAVVAPPK